MIEKFLERVEPEPNSGCWLWIGHVNDNGYGLFHLNGRNVRAHRFAYEHYRGPVPEGLDLDHLCRNRACCNPDHLEAVTRQINIKRGAIGSKTHCVRGHEFTKENTGTRTERRHGGRYCRACAREKEQRRRDLGLVKSRKDRARTRVGLVDPVPS